MTFKFKKQNHREVNQFFTILKKIPLSMKLTLLLMSISFSILHATESYSQSVRLSLELTNMSIQTVLDKIEDQSEFNFFYNNKQINTQRLVSVKKENAEVFAILDELFANTNVIYRVLDKSIILSTDESRLNVSQQDDKSLVIKGVVTDNSGEAIIGANVIEKGTTNGVVTDADGRFSLTLSKEAVLQVSYVGYITQEISDLSVVGGGG
jgi:hypothetical protein